ncbi:uncharacterized protein DNG_02400 [Cephalotrichum gorgonifer]|uniref:DUF6536 domain-containing protein n=1 Tax=Cephalotrichum gorgonifer TaxID=2041049 RepID=A0AAE8ST82_9PEZI|nr:uncharacterized protein DNG_02400 [Cephalotrichum gorgonifer]
MSYRYTWDQNGEVERIDRVDGPVDHTSASQTLQWPFLDTNSGSSPKRSPSRSRSRSRPRVRPVTWDPHQTHLYSAQSSPSTVDKSLIPDYVVNYLRGETPETVALRASMRPRGGARGIDVRRGDNATRSRAADFYFSPSGTESGASIGGPAVGGTEKGKKGGGSGRLVGWKSGIAINTLIALLIFVVSVVSLTLALSRSDLLRGEAPVYAGDCGTARRIEMGLQILTNILAVVLLAIANYVFQALVSPTRVEVALAHERQRWLDIGVPFNSVFFVSRTGASNFVFITEDFLNGAPFSNSSDSNAANLSRIDLLALQGSASRDELANLTTSQCLASLASPASYAAVMVITDIKDARNSLLQTAQATSFLASHLGPEELRPGVAIDRSSISFCLAQEASEPLTCELRLSGPLLGTVALLNLVIIVSTGSSALLKDFHPLATLGDALTSFLDVPDPTTSNACLLTRRDVTSGKWPLVEAKHWAPSAHWWLMTVSPARWSAFLLTWCIPTGLGAAALVAAIRSNPGAKMSPFGEPSGQMFVFGAGTSRAGVCVLAGLPHLLLAALYVSLNALLSTYFLSHELAGFAIPENTPRALRVSGRARGAQTKSLYITLPRPWSWLLILLFSAAGFLLSSSLVVVAVDAGTALSPSPVPLLALLCVLIAILAVPLGLGLRRADARASFSDGQPAGNPLAVATRGGSCSAVISSKCHAPPPRSPRARRGPDGSAEVEIVGVNAAEGVSWGVIREGVPGVEPGRTGFANNERAVGMVGVGRAYA